MVTAFVFINTRSGKEKEVLGMLKAIEPGIREAHTVYGDFDIVTKVETESLDMLNQFIAKKLMAMESVTTTNTLIGL